jgi:hypothetical protein
MFLDRGGQV